MAVDGGFRVESLDHVEFYVPDQVEAAEWYADRLGFQPLDAFAGWIDGGPLMIAVDGGRAKLALFQGEPAGQRPAVGYQRVAFRVDGPGFRAFQRHVADHPVCDAAGGPLTHLEVVDHGLALSLYFSDPWGHPLEVTTYVLTQGHGCGGA